MKLLFLLLLSLIIPVMAFSQLSMLEDVPIPQLKQKLKEATNDTSKVNIMLALGRATIHQPDSKDVQTDSVLNLAAQAKHLSRKSGYNDGIINSMLLTALCYNKKNDNDRGFKTAQQALKLAGRLGNKRGMAESYIIMGHHYDASITDERAKRIELNNKALSLFREQHILLRLASLLKDQAELLFLEQRKTEAVKLLFESLNINKAIGYKRIQGAYWLIARNCSEMGDFPNAIKYNLLAVNTAHEVKDTTLQLCSIYYNTALTYYSLVDYNRCITYALLALNVAKKYNNGGYMGTVSFLLSLAYTRTHQLPKSLVLINATNKWASTDDDRLIIAGFYLVNYYHANHLTEAGIYADKVKKLVKKIPADGYNYLRNAYSYLAQYYFAVKQYEQAQYYCELYANIVYKLQNGIGIRNAERQFYQIDSAKGNFKAAIEHQLISQRVKYSLDNVTKAYQISMLQIENDTEKKIEHINALTKQAQFKDDQIKRNRLIQKIITGGIILLLIIIALIYSRYRLKIRINALLIKQKQEIDRQNADLQDLVHDKNQLIDDKDDLLHEKDLLLKEVNHRVKNNLQIVMSLLQSQSGYMQNTKAQQAILESQNRVQSIALIHNQLYTNDKVAEIDIRSYITELVHSLDDSLNRNKDQIVIRCDLDELTLDVSQAIPLGIILNEAVTNALKYAFPAGKTGYIFIKLKQREGEIELQVSDNGVGCPPDMDMIKANSLGMTLITGLAAQLKGAFTIENNDGITLTVKFAIETTAITGVKA